jgi:hypothetical protein
MEMEVGREGQQVVDGGNRWQQYFDGRLSFTTTTTHEYECPKFQVPE